MRAFRPERTTDRTVREYLEEVSNTPFLNGHLLRDLSLASGANEIPHGLGRKLTGYAVTRKSANVNVWDTQGLNTRAAETLSLVTSGAVVIDAWVF